MTYRIVSEEDDRNHLAEITMLEEMVAEAERSRALNHAAAQVALKQRDLAKEQLRALKTQLHWLCETIAAHEIESLSCDRDGETYCDCLKKEAAKSADYLKTLP